MLTWKRSSLRTTGSSHERCCCNGTQSCATVEAIAVIVVSMFACLLMGIAVVQSMDTAVYDSLPPAMLALAGIPAGASISAMVYAQMLGFLGAITVAGFAVAVGARMIAGEEKDGTLSLLLSYPVSRLGVGMAKSGWRLVLAVAAISLGLWGCGTCSPERSSTSH